MKNTLIVMARATILLITLQYLSYFSPYPSQKWEWYVRPFLMLVCYLAANNPSNEFDIKEIQVLSFKDTDDDIGGK